MCRRLISYDIRHESPAGEVRKHVGRVAFQRNRTREALVAVPIHPRQRIVQIPGALIDVSRCKTTIYAARIDVDHEGDAAVHRDRERLGAAHAAEARRYDQPPRQAAAEVAPAQLGKGFVRALQDALRTNIDPAASRHLAIHRQTAVFEIAERVPVGPRRHEQGIGDDHARRPRVRAENGDRLAGLDDERFVVFEAAERGDDGVEGRPATRGPARSAVDDEILRPFSHLGIEVVHQHPQGGFLWPAFAGEHRTTRRADMTAYDVHDG